MLLGETSRFLTQYRGTVGVFNNENFSFNYKGPYIKCVKGGEGGGAGGFLLGP